MKLPYTITIRKNIDWRSHSMPYNIPPKVILCTLGVFLLMLTLMVFITATYVMNTSDLKTEIQAVKNTVARMEKTIVDKDAKIESLTATVRTWKTTQGILAIDNKLRNQVRGYILNHYKTTPPSEAESIAKAVVCYSNKYNVPVSATVGIMETESGFNSRLVSKKYARGPMQVMYSVHGQKKAAALNLKSKYQLHDIYMGTDSGLKVFRMYLNQTRGSIKKALCKYIGGPNSMRRNFKPSKDQEEYINLVYGNIGRFTLWQSNMDKGDHSVKTKKTTPKTYKHKIKYIGETLGLMAIWYTGDVKNWTKIKKANPGIDPLKLQIGQTIVIPVALLKNINPLPESIIPEV